MMERLYYVIDMRHRGALLMFWRANNSGYTYYIDYAGKYTESQIKAGGSYYHSQDTMAVACEFVDAFAARVVPDEQDNLQKLINCQFKGNKHVPEKAGQSGPSGQPVDKGSEVPTEDHR